MENYVTCTENMFFFCVTCKNMCKKWISTHRKRMHFSRVAIYQFSSKHEINNEWYFHRDNKKKYPALLIYSLYYQVLTWVVSEVLIQTLPLTHTCQMLVTLHMSDPGAPFGCLFSLISAFLLLSSSPPWEMFFFSWTWVSDTVVLLVSTTAFSLCILSSLSPGPAL